MIRNDEIKAFWGGTKQGQCFSATRRDHGCIAQAFEHHTAQTSNGLFVIHEQHAPRAARDRRCSRFGCLHRLMKAGKIEGKRTALVGETGHVDSAIVIAHNALDHCESHARPFLWDLGSEKWLENTVQDGLWYPMA